MKTPTLIILIVVAVFGAVLTINFGKNTSIYSDFGTAKKTGRQIHVVGEWVNRDQSSYNPASDEFTFFLKDTLQQVEQVLYHDPKPMNFEQAQKVVVVGQYEGEQFVADQIVMKCPSKYEETDVRAAEKTGL